MSLPRALAAVVGRELRLAARAPAEAAQPLLFYVLVVALFPLGVAPNEPSLPVYAPALVWIAALLASLMTLERVFRNDYEDGSLEQLALAPLPLPLSVLAKLAAHWLLGGLPLVLVAPLLAAGLGLDAAAGRALTLALLLGTPTLVLLGGFAAALTVGLPRAGVLLPILVLPMLSPVLIFGAGAARAAAQGLDPTAPLYFLAALLALSLTLVPFAAAAALRNALES
jgi:heme exporter protein B